MSGKDSLFYRSQMIAALAAVESAGIKIERLNGFPGVASARTPDGERIELFENAAQNLTFTPDVGRGDAVADRHNRPVGGIVFHHIHLYLPAVSVAAAKEWYVRMFGGTPGKRSTLRWSGFAWSEYQLIRSPVCDHPSSRTRAPTHRLRSVGPGSLLPFAGSQRRPL
jgi:hypothetical protein